MRCGLWQADNRRGKSLGAGDLGVAVLLFLLLCITWVCLVPHILPGRILDRILP